MTHNLFDSLQDLTISEGKSSKYYSLPALETRIRCLPLNFAG